MVSMHTISQDGYQTLQPVKQKVRVYNPSLLTELLHEAERAKQHAQVRAILPYEYDLGCST